MSAFIISCFSPYPFDIDVFFGLREFMKPLSRVVTFLQQKVPAKAVIGMARVQYKYWDQNTREVDEFILQFIPCGYCYLVTSSLLLPRVDRASLINILI